MVACEKWKRFQLYCSLIRTLDLRAYFVTGPSTRFLEKMVEYSHDLKTTPLLPRLRGLRVQASFRFKLAWVPIFFCPSLVSLGFVVLGESALDTGHTADLDAFLGCLWKELLSLNHASVLLQSYYSYEKQFDQTLKATYAKLEHLRSLECTSTFAFGRVGLESLVQLPKLLELAIIRGPARLQTDIDCLPGYPDLPDLCPDLRRIRLQEIDLATASRFLECLPSTLLEIDIETKDDAVNHFIGACVRFKALQSFTMREFGRTPFSGVGPGHHVVMLTAIQDRPLHLDWLSPLVECKELKTVKIEWARPGIIFTVNDDPLILFAKSWAHIEVFELRTFRVNIDWPGLDLREELYSAGSITENALLAFATHCRQLRTLCLPHLTMDFSTDYTIPSPSLGMAYLTTHKLSGDLDRAVDLISNVWPNTRWYAEGGVSVMEEMRTDDEEEYEDEADGNEMSMER